MEFEIFIIRLISVCVFNSNGDIVPSVVENSWQKIYCIEYTWQQFNWNWSARDTKVWRRIEK
jgi:hypothetical protein